MIANLEIEEINKSPKEYIEDDARSNEKGYAEIANYIGKQLIENGYVEQK